ncbi:4-fold beta flower protein [Cupriavidus plantarum]|uniref:4-fold beta flower protein n=1 Tax=Cupriavidus plantarum TaxID=942865 RepID=UPI00359C2E9D
MTPLFDKTGNVALWLKGDHLFSTDMKWMGFIVRDSAWSASSGSWLGKVAGSTIQDQRGRAVVWAPSVGKPQSGPAPAQPAKPAKPARPASPARPAIPPRIAIPAATWSSSSLLAWLAS